MQYKMAKEAPQLPPKRIILSKFKTRIDNPIKRYKTTIDGTRFELTLTMDFNPPNITTALIIDKKTPKINFHINPKSYLNLSSKPYNFSQ